MKINNEAELRKLYGWPKGRAEIKVLNRIDAVAKHFLAHSPFVVISTYDRSGRADASPRGGHAGFVQVLDETTLLIPDAKGNNRVDSLVNIVETGQLASLFLIPGIDETLRVNGQAHISTDTDHLDRFTEESKPPKTCIVVHVEEVFLHCAKAFMRSDLWGDRYRQSRPGFPTMGDMLNKQLNLDHPRESQEEMVKRYQKDL